MAPLVLELLGGLVEELGFLFRRLKGVNWWPHDTDPLNDVGVWYLNRVGFVVVHE